MEKVRFGDSVRCLSEKETEKIFILELSSYIRYDYLSKKDEEKKLYMICWLSKPYCLIYLFGHAFSSLLLLCSCCHTNGPDVLCCLTFACNCSYFK